MSETLDHQNEFRNNGSHLLRRFVIIGQRATASPDFSLDNLPASSGRLDVLLRCLRAALLVSHGLRRDTVVYLVLLGGPRAPRTLRVDGATARFLRPDERSMAVTVRKALAAPVEGAGFVPLRNGFAVADGGLSAVLEDLSPMSSLGLFVLEEGAPDLREAPLTGVDPVFFLGDHLGYNVICYYCAFVYLHNANVQRNVECTFIHKGFSQYKNAKEILRQHESSGAHKLAISIYNQMKEPTIDAQLSNQIKESQADCRTAMLGVMHAIWLSVRQGFALRGHNDEDGNLRELLQYTSKLYPELSNGCLDRKM
jgi:tRNA (pseudouridine54-N1)-methyltransferase